MAQVGAAIGRTFDYELLSSVLGWKQSELQTALQRLADAGLLFVRGVAPQSTYLFKHALVQDAAYSMLLRSRRQELHARVATILEQVFPESVEQQPERLAQHCTEAELIDRAIDYWIAAGRKSVMRSAMVEAAAQLRQGLKLLPRLSDEVERSRRELDLQVTLSGALVATRGQSASETVDAYLRARDLCEQLGNRVMLARVLAGQSICHFGRAEYAEAIEVADDLLKLGTISNNTSAQILGFWAKGASQHIIGQLASSAESFEHVLELYVPETHSSIAKTYPFDPRSGAYSYLSGK